MRKIAISSVFFGVVFMAASIAPAQRPDVPLTDQNVEKAITKAVEFIFSKQKENGSWDQFVDGKDIYTDGPTAMCVYALVASGVPAKDPKIAKALDWMARPENQAKMTYSAAFRCLAWYTVNKQLDNKYSKQLATDVDTLVKCTGTGVYTYSTNLPRPAGQGDMSNSQYGIYGVWTGARAGIEIPKDYWDKCLKFWIKYQNADGGWAYGRYESNPQGDTKATMVTAGLASLFVCIDWLFMDKFIKCQATETYSSPVKKGLDWMDKNFDDTIAQSSIPNWYYLYGVERVGLASGYKYFGKSDWYKAGASLLLKSQQAGGQWGRGDRAIPDTCYALLFLIRGRLPVLINRLEYDSDWSNRPRALANFCRWSEKAFETEANWQIITLKSDVNEWHDAPILTITGSKEPKFSAEDIEKLRAFVYQGGTLFSMTECAGLPFTKGIKELYKKLFPKYELAVCGRDHPLNTLLYKSGASARFSEIHNGIRPLAMHTDVDLPLSWQQYQVATGKANFESAANVVMYVTDKQFKFRGSKVWPAEPKSPPAKTLKIARLRYAGNYDPEPLALQRVSRVMATNYGINVDWQWVSAAAASAPASGPAQAVPPTGILPRDLTGDVKLAVMTGTGGFNLEQADRDTLKKWVDAGGILLLDAAGTKGFSDSAKNLIEELWGADSLLPLPLSSPIYLMKDLTIEKVKYRRTTRARVGGIKEPRLMAVLAGDRPKVLFSQEDLNGGLVGYSSYNCDGYEPDSALDMMRNVILYAATAPAIPAASSGPALQPGPASQPPPPGGKS
ncbi:MAG: DUF4159 domain-containing protein [Planctomycetes bacterium]|nr:DUF4159 domain-containing protein [Planctomycetota bacterium]